MGFHFKTGLFFPVFPSFPSPSEKKGTCGWKKILTTRAGKESEGTTFKGPVFPTPVGNKKLKDIDEGENPSILFTTVAIHTNKEPNQFRFFM